MTHRIDQIASQLDQLAADAMLVTDEINVSYLSGFTGDSSYLLVEPNRTTILSDGRYETQIAQECPDLVPVVRTSATTMLDALKEVLSGSSAKRIAIEAAHTDLASFRKLAEKCPDHEWIETSEVVEQLRMIKDAAEIETIRRSVRITEQTFTSVMAKLRLDWSEREIAHEIESTMRFLGADGVSFVPIVAAGPSGALPHYRPSSRCLGDEATLLVDWGAFYQGYASDMTRTLHRDHASDRVPAGLSSRAGGANGGNRRDSSRGRGVCGRRGRPPVAGQGGAGRGLQTWAGPRHWAANPRVPANVLH